MTRTEAFQHLWRTVCELPLDDIQRNALRQAIVNYGHAAAQEMLSQCKEAIKEVYGGADV